MIPFSPRDVHSYIVDCLMRESPPRVSELADHLGVSRMTLMRWFRDQLGTTPSAYLRRARLRHAQGMLYGTSLTTTAVGYRSGFGTRRTFYRVFRNETAMSPAEFRQLTKAGPEISGPADEEATTTSDSRRSGGRSGS